MLKSQFWPILPLFFLLFPRIIYSQENELSFPGKKSNIIYENEFSHKTDDLQKKKKIRKLSLNDYLFSFIDSGNYQFVSYLLIKGANPNFCDTSGITPLMIASMNGDTSITKLLIKKGANVNFKNFRGENALYWAIIGRKVEQLKLLIDNRSEINNVDINGISPLFYALGYTTYDLINYANDDYNNFFTPDTSYSTTYKLLKTLIQSGADINQVNELDCTPLLFATFQKDTSLIKILCKLGANPNKTTQNGVTPLVYATQEDSYGTVKTLIKNGANINYMLSDGNSALFIAVRANNDSIAELLLQFKALVNEKNNLNLTPLHYAAGFGYPFMTDLLISYGANVNEIDNNGNTPIIASVYSGAEIVTDILIGSGVDVNIPDKKGNTPLMIATQFNDTVLIRKLYKAGADLNSLNKKNFNALSIAIENNSVEAFKKLIAMGANTENTHLNKSYYQQSKEVGSTEITSFLSGKGLKTKLKLNISEVNFYTGFSASQRDFMLDFGGGIHESVSNILLNIGYKYRPYSNRVLVYKNSSFYQFWEKRYSFYLSFQHLLILNRNYLRGNVGFVPGLSNEFTWQYYRGVAKGSGIKWILVPSIGLFYQKRVYTIIGKWEFANYSKQILGSNRFNLQILFSIPASKKFINKKINWLD